MKLISNIMFNAAHNVMYFTLHFLRNYLYIIFSISKEYFKISIVIKIIKKLKDKITSFSKLIILQ